MLLACHHTQTNSEKVSDYAKVAFECEGVVLKGFRVDEKSVMCLFVSHKHAGLDEARRVMVGLTRRLLTHLHCDEIKEENLTLKILFQELDETPVIEGYISEVLLRKNRLQFFIWDSINHGAKRIFQEDFEDSFGHAYGYEARNGFRPFSSWESL